MFPVIYSTLACEAVHASVLSCYEIPEVKNCQLWHRGLSDVYLIETYHRPYILRISHHHWRSRSQIDFELEWLDFLHRRHLPVAPPLTTQDGLLCVEIDAPEGKRYAALFHYAPGSVAIGDLNATQSWRLGEIVAKIHQAAREFCPRAHREPLTPDYLLHDSLKIIAPFLQHRPSDLQELTEAIAHIETLVRDLPKAPPHWSICWGDPHSGNAHFTPEGNVTLFDFDQCGYGWRVFDIARFWHASMQAGLNRAVRNAFLNGYQTVESLSDEEHKRLQPLVQAAHIWMWAINLKQERLFNYSRLDDRYFTHRLEYLKLLKSHDWQLF